MDAQPPPEQAPVINASELAQYSFCHRAWWLATVRRVRPRYGEALTRGRRHHTRHRKKIQAAALWQRIGFWLGVAGGLFLLAALLGLWIGG